MAGRPLRPATDRRLGGPLPRQPANQSSAAPFAPGLAVPGFHPQVLCGISHPFGWLSPTNGHVPMYYSPVRHSPSESKLSMLPFDLHVLGAPPAFVLSQDQTLYKMVSKRQKTFKSILQIFRSVFRSDTIACVLYELLLGIF